jgi:hypothetical protein
MAIVLCILPKSSVPLCIFLWAQEFSAKRVHEEMCPVYGGRCFSYNEVHKLVEKFSQGRSKVADDALPGRPVEIATEVTQQQLEELVRADSVATTRRCSHGLSCSIMHDRLKFRKVCARWVPRELKDRDK